jgi:MFS transporter, UMF1 family
MKRRYPAKSAVISWCFFDWGISAFPVLITTFIFGAYFTEKVAVNKIIGTAQWGEINGLAGLIVALLSPILGAIADRQGRRKPWLLVLACFIFIAAGALGWVKPEVSYVQWALLWVAVGTAAVEISNVFYNAMLSELAPPDFLGRFSGWGWGAGYIGGLLALIIALFLYSKTPVPIRICGPLVAIWVLLFTWPLFVFTPDRPGTGIGMRKAIVAGLASLKQLLKLLGRDYRNILILLIARMIYIDGLITVFAFGGIYAAGVFNMSLTQIIEFGIGMNAAAGVGAAVFGWLDDARGPKLTILLALLFMIVCGVAILLIHNKIWFWIFGMGLSLGVGPVQAASRSLLIRLSPPELIGELFGLYNFSGKATSFAGPWLLALTTHWFNSQRAGMASAFLFMLLGGLLLLYVRYERQIWSAR